MEKPNARGPSSSRKAHLALRERLNRKPKRPPMPAFATATAGKPAKKSSYARGKIGR